MALLVITRLQHTGHAWLKRGL